jgi:RNA polymerase sigma factor (sigma-70 family)
MAINLESISDNSLMLKVKSGDLNKLGLLYERYNKSVFGFFYRNTSNREISEDLAQMLFERILKYRKNFRGDGKFITWMYSIARNILYDHYKLMKRKGYSVEIDERISTSIYDQDSDQVFIEEKHQLLNKAMSKLEGDKRELLILSRYQGLKYKDIANMMQTTEGAIRIKIFRALNDLRKHYLKLERIEAL